MTKTPMKAAGRKPSGEPRTIAPTPDGLRRAASMEAEGREPSGNVQITVSTPEETRQEFLGASHAKTRRRQGGKE